tara:strand:+ start:1755 stop:2156 length:402 start_codon:yes stop_codon:yes gene_type:complete
VVIGDTNITEHFQLKELWSPDNQEIQLNSLFHEHMELLEKMRTDYGIRMSVNSGHRSLAHNSEVGGAANSMHLRFATDITPIVADVDLRKNLSILNDMAEEMGFQGIGRYNTFIHLDRRDLLGWVPARWDKRT